MCGTASCSSLATMLARSPSRHKRKCRLCDPLELPLERRNVQTTNSREHCAPRRQQASQWVGSQERRHATQGRTGSTPRKGGASADGREPAIASSPSAGAGRPVADLRQSRFKAAKPPVVQPRAPCSTDAQSGLPHQRRPPTEKRCGPSSFLARPDAAQAPTPSPGRGAAGNRWTARGDNADPSPRGSPP